MKPLQEVKEVEEAKEVKEKTLSRTEGAHRRVRE
jgi:hypothetical protein